MKHQYQPGDMMQCDMTFNAQAASDAPEGYVMGTASAPTLDLHGHKVMAGAFDESIKTKGLYGPRSVKLLAHHDWSKPAGVIKRLDTLYEHLRIEAQLNLNVSYVRDLHEIAKQNGGLSFSVGFYLQEFDFEQKDGSPDETLVISKGDLTEVSVVTFPAQPEATMDFIKHADTPSAFEKALLANGWAKGRNEAHKLMLLCKNSLHLFEPPVLVPPKGPPARPVLDVSQLKAATDLTLKLRSLLGTGP